MIPDRPRGRAKKRRDFKRTYDAGASQRNLALLRQGLEAKFRGLVEPVLGDAAATRLARIIDRTDTLDYAAESRAASRSTMMRRAERHDQSLRRQARRPSNTRIAPAWSS